MSRYTTVLTRSQLYHHAARLFAYPEDTLGVALAAGREAAASLSDGEILVKRFADAEEAWEETTQEAAGAAGEYTWLFLRNVRCPLHETAFEPDRSVAMAHDLSQLAGFYAAYGVQIAEDFRDLPDHLSMELEFISYLYAKEAYALEQQWKRRAKACRMARRQFLQEHLGRWVAPLVERVGQHARSRFYPAAAALVQALLDGEQLAMEDSDERAVVAPA